MDNKRQERYKKKPMGLTDTATGRLVRTVKLEERRRVQRAENYAKHRDAPEAHDVEDNRLRPSNVEKKLSRWKAEREIKKKMEAQKKKPAFKVGVVHHKFYSPPVREKNNSASGPCHPRSIYKVKHQPTPPKRITRATQKRLDAKLAGASVTPVATSTSGPKRNLAKSIKKRLPSMTKEAALTFAPKNYSFKAPAGLLQMPIFGRFAIPNRREADESSIENDVERDRKENEKPWPRASNPPVDIMATQNQQSFASSDSLETLSRGNSSMEAFTLRLSSDDESPEETDSPEQPKSAKKVFEVPEIENKIDSDVANADDDAGEDVEKIDDCQDNEDMEKIDDFEDNEEVEKINDLADSEVLAETVQPDVEESEEIASIIGIECSTPPRSGTPVPASFSPYIVSSRGKESARKEQQIKMGIRRSSANEIPTKDTVMQNLNISVEEEEQTAQYFKFILQREIDRLTEMCNKWEMIMKGPDLTEDAQYQINQAVGQTNLLINKKFERFRRLVSDCETGKGEMLVQCKDLQGFWDMMYMEVKDCESRFLKLEFLKSKGWIEEQHIAVASNKVTRKKIVDPVAKPKINAKSSARSWIMAARKKKLSQKEDQDTDEIIIATKDTESEKTKSVALPLNQDENSRRSLRQSSISNGFDRRQSTPKATPRKTPTSLLRKVQLSQASKSVRSPLAIMKISKMCKTPEVELDGTISYVNSNQTPGKGILKKSDDTSSQESSPPKSCRKVDFNDEVFLAEVAVENDVSEELQNSLDLGRSLAKIDSYEDDDDDDDSDADSDVMKNITLRKVEKRLDFEDDSFDETENTDTGESAAIVAAIPESREIPTINVVQSSAITSETANVSANTSRRSSSRILEASIDEEQLGSLEPSIKVLRNRTVVAVTPSKSNRRSVRSFAGIGNDNSFLDSSTKENSDPLGRSKKETNLGASNEVGANPASVDLTKRRRSTRKSVRFNADDCTACAPKPTLPMTPHSRRSKKISLLGESSRESVKPTAKGDLMTFDSPAKHPARIRKSSHK